MELSTTDLDPDIKKGEKRLRKNAVTIITQDEVVEVPETTKWEVAQRVLDQVVRVRQQRKTAVKV